MEGKVLEVVELMLQMMEFKLKLRRTPVEMVSEISTTNIKMQHI